MQPMKLFEKVETTCLFGLQARNPANVVREGAAQESADERGRVASAWGTAVARLGALRRA